MRERLRRSRLLRSIRFLPYLIPYAIWATLLPVRANRFLFLTDSRVGYAGNMLHVRDALLAQDPTVEIIGVFKPRLAARRPLRDALRLPYLIATSGVILLDDFYPLIYRFRIRRGARLVQLWHAAGAFKRVGHSRAGMPGGPTPGSEIHRNYTDAVVSSAGIVPDYAEAFGIPESRVKPWGMPRTDVFFDEAHVAATRQRVRSRLGIRDDERFALYAPTFRGNGQRSAVEAPDADWAGIAASLGAGWRVGVRQHPFVRSGALPAGVIDAATEPEMNDLLMAVDVLITDYSSSIFEFALLRRPVVFFVPDLADYEGARSFFRPFSSYAIGPVVDDAAGIAEAVRTASVDEAVFDAFLAEFAGALDGRSSARVAGELLSAVGVAPSAAKEPV